MNLCARFIRGLSIAGFVLGGIVLSVAAVSLTDGGAYAQTLNSQTVNSIVVEGNRRVEASTVRSYFKVGPSGRLDAQVIDLLQLSPEPPKPPADYMRSRDDRLTVQGGARTHGN